MPKIYVHLYGTMYVVRAANVFLSFVYAPIGRRCDGKLNSIYRQQPTANKHEANVGSRPVAKCQYNTLTSDAYGKFDIVVV